MQSRRSFLRLAAGAAAGAFLGASSAFSLQRGPSPRRQVAIGNRRIRVIDIHGHFLIPEEADLVRNTTLAGNVINQLNGPPAEWTITIAGPILSSNWPPPRAHNR